MLGLTIAAIVTVAAGYLIVKRAYAPAVLLVAGVVLLAIAAFGDIGLGLGLKKSSGSIFFDIFLVVVNHDDRIDPHRSQFARDLGRGQLSRTPCRNAG